MQEEQPDLAERIVEYQLKAKDVLARAFLQQDDPFAGMSTELKAIIMHDKKLQIIESRMDKLENTMTIDYSQQEMLRTMVGIRAVEVLGGKESTAYKKINRKVFSGIWNEFKQKFGVASYKDTSAVKFEEAQLYLANWTPDYNLLLEIEELNSDVAV